jgi:hypothetical protein
MKPYFFSLIAFFLILYPARSAFAQTDTSFVELPDSIRQKEHSPTKATLMSACLPGLGQVYNRKYWKVPIVYAGFGIMTYFIVTNLDEYMNYKCAYIELSNGNRNGNYSYLINPYTTTDELLSAREYYRRNLEISILITVLWYALNILDATVDAHLYTFNISDKLAIKVEPALLPTSISYKPAAGLKLSLRF